MLNKIKLYGRLARFVGERSFEAEVQTPAQAIRFLLANFPNLEKHMIEQNYCVKIGNVDLQENELDYPLGQQEIKIIPVVVGSKGATKFIIGAVLIGIAITNPAAGVGLGGATLFGTSGGAAFTAVLGNVGIMLAVSGASEILSPTPKPPGVSDDPQSLNFSFNGVQNTGRAGVPIPVVYGEIFCGSLVVSAGIDTVQLEAD